MKKPLTFLSFLLVTIGALAQGQVNFAARVAGVYDAPVFIDCRLLSKAEGPGYMVQLYAGTTQFNLAPVGKALPLLTGADAGYWNAEVTTINTVDATGNAYVQVRGWATAPTFEAALLSGYPFGGSALITVKPTTAPDLPATLVGLTGFGILTPPIGGNSSCVPEPSIVLLAVLGSVPFLLRRRS